MFTSFREQPYPKILSFCQPAFYSSPTFFAAAFFEVTLCARALPPLPPSTTPGPPALGAHDLVRGDLGDHWGAESRQRNAF
jgi:hypothetical protein